MELNNDERTDLKAALLSAFSTIDFFKRLVQGLGRNPDDFAPQAGLTDRIDTLVRAFEAQDEVLLLLEVPPTLPGWQANAGLKAALENVKASYLQRRGTPRPALANPLDATVLDMGRPFIDRKEFRTFLADLVPESGKRYLVVNGPLGSGKTHSQYLIEEIKRPFDFQSTCIVLEQEFPSTYHPDVFARRIDRDLRLPDTEPMPAQQNVGDRWAQEICDWLVEKMLAGGERYWIVLDGFGHPALPEETKRLVAALIHAVDRRLRRVRLVLLDYPEALPRHLRPFVPVDIPPRIGKTELEEYFKAAFTQNGIEADEQQVVDLAGQILAGLPAEDEERTFEIMLRVTESLQQVLP